MGTVLQRKQEFFQLFGIVIRRLGPQQLNRVVERLTAFDEQVVAQENLSLGAERRKFFNDAERLLRAFNDFP